MLAMPRKSKLTLPPLDLGEESLGQRFARIRKEKGYTQVELADKMGIIQGLVSDYERDKLRPHAEMVIRFAQALDVSADDLLGLNGARNNELVDLHRLPPGWVFSWVFFTSFVRTRM